MNDHQVKVLWGSIKQVPGRHTISYWIPNTSIAMSVEDQFLANCDAGVFDPLCLQGYWGLRLDKYNRGMSE